MTAVSHRLGCHCYWTCRSVQSLTACSRSVTSVHRMATSKSSYLLFAQKTKHKDLVRHGKLSTTKFTCKLAPFKILSQETNQSDYKMVAKTKGGSNEMMTGK